MIHFLSNTAGRAATKILVTNNVDVEQTAEYGGIRNILGGGRHLVYTQTGTVTRRLVYLNKGGTLSFNYLFIRNSNYNSGNTINIRQWTTYSSSGSNLMTSVNLNSYRVGRTLRDSIVPVSNSGTIEACGIEGGNGYQANYGQIFFSQAVSVDAIGGGFAYTRQVLPERSQQIKHMHNWYHLEAIRDIILVLDKATIASYWKIPKEDPLVIYDDASNGGVGALIPDKAIYGIILSEKIYPVANDLYQLSITFGELREWD